MAKISAIINAYNEEGQIGECLETIKWVDEIIVMDCFSNDRTVEICRDYTDKIYQRRYINYAEARNWMLNKASFEWILSVDADERYTVEFANEVKKRLESKEDYNGYYVTMIYYVYGLRRDYFTYRQIRLFKNGKASWEDKWVHPRLILEGKVGELKNPVYHYPYPDIYTFLEKTNRYTSWIAKERLREKVKMRWYDFPWLAFVRGILLFLRGYFTQDRLIRYGMWGFLNCFNGFLHVFLTEAKYWELLQQEKRKKDLKKVNNG